MEIFFMILTALIPFLLIMGIIYGMIRYYDTKRMFEAEDIVVAYINKNGRATLDDIVLVTRLPYKSVKKVLKNLSKDGLITIVRTEGKKYYVLKPK